MSLTGDQVSSLRTERADLASRPRKPVDDRWRASEHYTTPGRQDEALKAAEHLAAARLCARWLMLAAHACTGPDCPSGDHDGDRAAMRQALEILGLRDYPSADRKAVNRAASNARKRERKEAAGAT